MPQPLTTTNRTRNRLDPLDEAAHGWYRFVLSFPPHLVRSYVQSFGLNNTHHVLDPFCGTGTTLVECKKLGIPSTGIEANPMARFAAQVKTQWSLDADGLVKHAREVSDAAMEELIREGIADSFFFSLPPARPLTKSTLRTLEATQEKLLLANSISPLPLHKVLVLLSALRQHRDDHYWQHELLALAKTLLYSSSNLHFGPEVGIGAIKADAPVIEPWLNTIDTMAADVRAVQTQSHVLTTIHQADARQLNHVLAPCSVDAVITSPPYPNEKDYTRTTRLESVLLGFISNRADLQALKRGLLRSNTRSVYKGDDDDSWVVNQPEVQRIAMEIEARRIKLGKTSGFERLYATVTRLYFGGMARHLAELRSVLRPGAQLAYVVGDQASYLQVMIHTGQILADIAQTLGYELVRIDLFRTRTATATRAQLREEVVVLRWPGTLKG